MVNYIVSDFIAKLNIARRNKLKTLIIIPTSKILELLDAFEKLGIIRGYIINDEYKIEIMLRYYRGKCAFNQLFVVSKPSKRINVDLLKLHKFKEKYSSDVLLLLTSKGLMFDNDCLKYRLGGQILLRISF